MSRFDLRKWFRRKQHDDIQSIKTVFMTEDGKALFRVLFKECGMNELSATDDDPYGTYLREGKRSVGLVFRSYLNMTDDELSRLLIDEKPPIEDYLNND